MSLFLLVSSLAGCGPAASEGGFDSANSAARIYAIEYAARDGDRNAIPQLVEQLNADDEAVRALAIASLERLTGQTKGYNDYDPIEIRRDAVALWVQAVHAGEFDNLREELNTEGHGEPRSSGEGEPQMNTDEHGGEAKDGLEATDEERVFGEAFELPFAINPDNLPSPPWPSVALRVPTSLTESPRG